MSYIDVFDSFVIQLINQFARKSELFDTIVFDIADSSLLKGGLFMAYFWWLWFRADRDTHLRRRCIIVSIAGGSVAALVSRILQQQLPFHVRPLHATDLGFVLPYGVDPHSLNFWNSFPSDHAVLFFALSTAVWYQSRYLGCGAMAWSLVVICLPRIYLGYHYPSDVIAGAVIGIALMAATHRLLRHARWPDKLMWWEATHRMAFYCVAFVITFEISVLYGDFRHIALDGFHILKSMLVTSV